MKILLSWSSGKDSAWALHVLRHTHPGSVAGLLTTINESVDRVAMHAVRRDVVEAQAAAAALPLAIVRIPQPCPNEVYEARMRDAVTAAVRDGFTHVAFGDLFLRDVRQYREAKLAGTGLSPLFPLWDRPTAALAREMLTGGLRATVVCVDTRLLPSALAGRPFDDAWLDALPEGIDPCGEQGEFHTCVHGGPMFSGDLAVVVGEAVTRDPFSWRDIALTAPVTGASRLVRA